ncbi:hypothetical protein V5799_009573 [Amblyomma americanum]|uniref:Single domain-containing protein n=1 Tax=Amblyomma americanum TaxID=6943 RepID=A0AAQ4FBB8_AMBAM
MVVRAKTLHPFITAPGHAGCLSLNTGGGGKTLNATAHVAVVTYSVVLRQGLGGQGKCLYNETEITPHEPFFAEFPCEEWECTSEGALTITGCGKVVAGRDCVLLKGSGVYPRCCEQVACH